MGLLKKMAVSVLFTALFAPVYSQKLPAKSDFKHARGDLYKIFAEPESKYRPYVRWWWNGTRVDEKEILRELDLMKQIGIGGVEINSIRYPGDVDTLGYAERPYLSDEWANSIRFAADACKERGLVCDMIGGSGWPFGGEFLPPDKQLQMLTVETIDIDGGSNGKVFSIARDEILKRSNPPIMSSNPHPRKELVYLRLLPKHVEQFTEGVYFDKLVSNEQISLNVPAGEYVLYCFIKFAGYMDVIEGAPGARGPVLNHFDKEAVKFYLNRLSEKIHFNSPGMKGKIRAAFVDSFELEGANWSDALLDEFERRYGYSLIPYLPYVIRKVGHMGDPLPEKYGSKFSAQVTENVVNRVRNDFERFQIELFKKNFIDTLNEWCHSNGLQSRVQAYGRALHPLESAMFIDIPECETWMRDNMGKELDDRNSYSGRAHSMVNKFVASGSLLAGNGVVSCEEMTNVVYIFQTTLEEIKVAGDMSNISGVNQSILHGFNYSPKEAPFPGWIKYGTYFSENNTWWPYLRNWLDYKARLSALMQNSVLQADIAILPPLEDMWSTLGQQRDPFPQKWHPAYAHDLWENLHENGNGCDYVSEHVIQQSTVKNGQLAFGPRAYKTLLLMEVESLDPQTAGKLEDFVKKGGKIVCIGTRPYKSVGFSNAARKDAEVQTVITRITQKYPDRFVLVDAPSDTEPLTQWYQKVQKKLELTPYVQIDKPDKFLTQNYYKSGNRDIFFFTNLHIEKGHDVHVVFPDAVKGKKAWLWDAETGKRYILPQQGQEQDLHFGPAESKLIVFDKEHDGEVYRPLAEESENPIVVSGLWDVKAVHVDKSIKEFQVDSLTDFNTLPFPWFRHFAGEIYYSIDVDVENPGEIHVLDAGLTHLGVTELILNGEKIGAKWYGNRKFDVSGKLVSGKNRITIKVTTLLGNYTKSLTNNPPAQRFASMRGYRSIGLEGPVKLY